MAKPNTNRKRQLSSEASGSSNGKENTPKRKKGKIKPDPDNTIAMSTQLATKKQARKRKSKNETPIPNGRPMPTFSHLEKMYEDSDSEDQLPSTSVEQNFQKNNSKKPKTPKLNSTKANENKILSSNTVNKIAEHMTEMITNINNSSDLLTQLPLPPDLQVPPDEPPPPVIPQKKRKKNSTPYMVGCQERPMLAITGSTNFCKGDCDYGIKTTPESEDDDDLLFLDEEGKTSKITGFSKSIFNKQSDEIAQRLNPDTIEGHSNESHNSVMAFSSLPTTDIENTFHSAKTPPKTAEDDTHSNGSSDSNKTLPYDTTDFRNLTADNIQMKSSPLPVTINDSDTLHTPERQQLSENNVHNNKSDSNITANECSTNLNVNKKPMKSSTPNTASDTGTLNSPNSRLDHKTNPNLSANNILATFSPLPSTSRDSNTFIKNDLLFNESLTHVNNSDKQLQAEDKDDIQIIETPCETITINDETESKPLQKIADDSSIVLLNDTIPKTEKSDEDITTIVIDDEYANIKFDNNFKTDDNEIIDVDELIEENKAIIGRISGHDSVIEVVEIPNSPSPEIQQRNTDNIYSYTRVNSSSQTRSNANIPNRRINSATTPAQRLTEAANSIGQFVSDFFRTRPTSNTRNNSSTRLPNRTVPNNRTWTHVHDDSSTDTFSSLSNEPSDDGICSSPTTNTDEESKNKAPSEKVVRESNENRNKNSIGECPICMDSLVPYDIASTICGHVFCLKCIKASIKSSGKKCPKCRKTLKGVGYHQLYL